MLNTRPFRSFVLGSAFGICLLASGIAHAAEEADEPNGGEQAGIKVGTFRAEYRETYTTADGLPSDNILSIAIAADGRVYAGTERGVARFVDGKWAPVIEDDSPVKLIAAHGGSLIYTAGPVLFNIEDGERRQLATLPESAVDPVDQHCLVGGELVLLGTTAGLFALEGAAFKSVDALNRLLGSEKDVRQVAAAPDGRIAVAAASGLYLFVRNGNWRAVHPQHGDRSWAVHDARGVAFDNDGRLWFASPQGVGVKTGDGWKLYTGHDGLPYNDFTTMTAGEQGVVWFGTSLGAIRYDGENWEYRMAPRWLPENLVRAIVVDSEDNAWFATETGLGSIERRPTTLAEKAQFFEDEIDKYHRRTPHGYVLSVGLSDVDDKSEWTQRDSDNDGLWTAMYGAGECFAYAVNKTPKARERATAAFEALRFLSQVTQGGSHPAPPGFPARTILPTSGENPNAVHYTPEKDQQRKIRDPQWKVLVPRWPTSADGKWYWKTDTSSDELDGHYFLYALYYDLVAESEDEKQRARDVVTAITDHLIANDYALIDHDGKPTRWARFGPRDLNGGEMFYQRGLNSLSILCYLKIAEHMTGDAKYGAAYEDLIENHAYHVNALTPKSQRGPGTGNQSDDEMAFMNYYHLLMYETDPRLRRIFFWSLFSYWRLEEPELCPLFNYVFAARFGGANFGFRRIPLPETCLSDALDTLRRYPVDRIRWSFQNSHRTDIVMLPKMMFGSRGKGHRRSGKVIPIDERSIEFWNHSPWQLDENHDGKTLTDGATFLLPYYMGLYHKFIIE